MADFKHYLDVSRRYRARFGSSIGLPFAAPGVDEWDEDRLTAQMEKCLKDDLPFDDSNPDYPWPGYLDSMVELASKGCVV